MPTGRTKDAGWQVGVQKTVHRPVEEVWTTLISPEGLALWLGSRTELPQEPGEEYVTDDGTSGELRSFRPNDRVRVTARREDADHETTVQIALEDKGPKTAVIFHEERLATPEERQRRRDHWQRVARHVKELVEQ